MRDSWAVAGAAVHVALASHAVSTFGTCLGFGAFPLIAILVLHSGPTEVSALPAAGLAVGGGVTHAGSFLGENDETRPVWLTDPTPSLSPRICAFITVHLGDT